MSAGRRALIMSLIAAGTLLMTAGLALGQGVTGGCSATVNGRAPSSMTEENPLVIEKGGSVVVEGTVPPSVAGLPRDQIQSTTTIKVEIVKGVPGPTIETRKGKRTELGRLGRGSLVPEHTPSRGLQGHRGGIGESRLEL